MSEREMTERDAIGIIAAVLSETISPGRHLERLDAVIKWAVDLHPAPEKLMGVMMEEKATAIRYPRRHADTYHDEEGLLCRNRRREQIAPLPVHRDRRAVTVEMFNAMAASSLAATRDILKADMTGDFTGGASPWKPLKNEPFDRAEGLRLFRVLANQVDALRQNWGKEEFREMAPTVSAIFHAADRLHRWLLGEPPT